MSYRWYALRVKASFEKYVTSHLEGRAYETFVPTYVPKSNGTDRSKVTPLPLFPKYVFCRFDLKAKLPIEITPGVMAIMGAGKLPTAVNDTEMQALRRVVRSGLNYQPCLYLTEGKRVRLEQGPLEGLTGILTRVRGVDRLVISISVLRRSIAIAIDRNWVKPLPSDSEANRQGVLAATGPRL